ncbi:endolytic transglycosylase MltG [Georgenia sp. Z1491]|uniref:endolytic transglycosylase MltG n=1 Tax=Georgenia sp. Z1491 TaxID=3416707 RepID=UPI003CF34A14
MSDLFDEVADSPAEPEGAVRASRREVRAQEEARRRRRRRRTRSVVVVVLTALALAAVAWFALPQVRDMLGFRPDTSAEDFPGPGSDEVDVTIPIGASGTEIASTLVEAGVVASERAFTDAYANNPDSGGIQPGTYTLLEEMRAEDAVAALLDPASRNEITMTIPEGFTRDQVVERVAGNLEIEVEEVAEAAADAEAIGLPEVAEGESEGWFGPATYAFEPDTTAEEVLAEMVTFQVDRLQQLGVPEEDWQSVLTRASIVEREVNIDEYMPQVATVIENRLNDTTETNGMLGMDSTVLYGMGETGGMPTSDDTANPDNPYNTYVHPGLPPTPIGSPGDTSIAAVLDPAEGDWLYFVTVNLDTGETLFASTLEEQNENVQLLREWQAENPSS